VSEDALSTQQPTQSVAQLVELLRSELSELSQQDNALRKLARGLSLLLRTLPKSSVLGTPPPESIPLLVRTSGRSRRKVEANESIRRACRIALMETEEAATVDEIYSRIVHRESFHFDNIYQAAAAIRQSLNSMTEQGEILVVETHPCPRWKRTSA
jgi:hypothetical protein